jgi:hypothetical protein
MLTRFRRVALFMRRSGVPVRFGGFVMMRGGFVVIVFWHMVIPEHSDGPCTRDPTPENVEWRRAER